MFRLLLEHELRNVIAGPRFLAVVGISAVLLVTSTIVGIAEYTRAVDRYDERVRSVDEEIRSADSWYSVPNVVGRKPDPMSLFVAGVSLDLGERAGVGGSGFGTPTESVYSSDTLFAFFRHIDFAFVFQIVLSLVAILFTYDRICGERASGTLRLVMANPVPRVTLVTAKLTGVWLGLVIPVLLISALCALIVLLTGVPLGDSGWIRFTATLVTSVVYLSCFVAIGMFVSSVAKDPASSFLTLLVIWAAFALIIPKVTSEIAGQVVRPMTVAQLEEEQRRFVWSQIGILEAKMNELGEEMRSETEGLSDEERTKYFDSWQDKWMKRYVQVRAEFDEVIAKNYERLLETRRAQVHEQQTLALSLSRVSPAASYAIASMSLAGTDLQSKDRLEDALGTYSKAYGAFVLKDEMRRQSETKPGQEPPKLDPTNKPEFIQPDLRVQDALERAQLDIGLLVLYTVLAVAATFVAFLRYDVR